MLWVMGNLPGGTRPIGAAVIVAGRVISPVVTRHRPGRPQLPAMRCVSSPAAPVTSAHRASWKASKRSLRPTSDAAQHALLLVEHAGAATPDARG